MINHNLLLNARDQDGLVGLLSAEEKDGGLGWPVDQDAPFTVEPEIAEGVKSEGRVSVSRLVPASADEKQMVLLAEFDHRTLRRDLRELLTSLRRHIRTTGRFPETSGFNDTLFIVCAPGYEDVRFVLFEERARRLPRIRSFGWRQEFIGRTVLTHNLERLRWSDRDRWEKAWDVEGLTDEFYVEFVRVFDAVKEMAEHPGGPEKKHAYVQQLLNRLLFIAFIERMGWLKTPDGSSDYLHQQWLRFQNRDHYTEVENKGLIPATFNGLLGELFFHALDNQMGVGPIDPLYPILGEVPYLNGGLFSEDAVLDVPGVEVKDEAFDLILGDRRPGFEGGLFRRFNFTVTESTPLDQEVAVDPEMLGKIFERIIVAGERHRTGTYYTPRPIVEFMVNEALKGYLTERGLPAPKAAMLVDEDRVESEELSFKPSEMQDTLDALFEVKAVDPACGSGAYLLMLLQRLFELGDRLEVVRDKKRSPNQKHLYNMKLRLLERCVYGVDISEIAVRIGRLRLWLSLVVENRGEKPEPLPNFDFLIMCGDSLASPVKPEQYTLSYPDQAIREYTLLKRRYFHPESGVRPSREEMATKREQIAIAYQSDFAYNPLRSRSSNPFDWEVEFAEVFDAAASSRSAGFDIVIANPPYVNSGELLQSVGKEYKQALIKGFPNTGSGTADLLVYFLDRAVELLKPGGCLSFITSNKWLKAGYGKKLRAHLAKTTAVRDLIDFHDLPVFQGTIAYPLITIAAKGRTAEATRLVSVPSLEAPYPDLSALVEEKGEMLLSDALEEDGEWNFEVGDGANRLSRMRLRGITLDDYAGHRIYRGIVTGLNEVKVGSDGKTYGKTVPAGVRVVGKEGVFVIDGKKRAELIAEDPRSAEVIKPLATGRDIRRWVVEQSDRWLIVTRIGTDMSRYPAVMRHLERFKDRLIPRADQGQNWWELRACAYYSAFDAAKIIYPDMAQESRFAYASSGLFVTNTAYLLPVDDLFLLAVLNSVAFNSQLGSMLNFNLAGTQRSFTDQMARAMIPAASEHDRTAAGDLVKRILDRKGSDPTADVSDLEAEIDRRVEFLYFHADEAPTYDEWAATKEAEKGTEIEAIRNLIAAGESGTLEFKQSLEYVDPAPFANVPEAQRNQKIAETQKAVVHSALKTLCAFLNSRGGTLLLGVHDKGHIIGIEPDYTLLGKKPDRDGFELKLTALLKTRIHPIPTDLDIRFVPIEGKTICRIRAPENRTPHYLDNKLYIRLGNSTEELTGRDLEDWLKGR